MPSVSVPVMTMPAIEFLLNSSTASIDDLRDALTLSCRRECFAEARPSVLFLDHSCRGRSQTMDCAPIGHSQGTKVLLVTSPRPRSRRRTARDADQLAQRITAATRV